MDDVLSRELVVTGGQRESSQPVYLVVNRLENKLLFCLKKKKKNPEELLVLSSDLYST